MPRPCSQRVASWRCSCFLAQCRKATETLDCLLMNRLKMVASSRCAPVRGWGLRRSHFVIPSVNLTWADLAELKVAEGGQQITDNGLDSLVTSPPWSDESVRAAPLSQAILRVVRKLSLPASGSVQVTGDIRLLNRQPVIDDLLPRSGRGGLGVLLAIVPVAGLDRAGGQRPASAERAPNERHGASAFLGCWWLVRWSCSHPCEISHV